MSEWRRVSIGEVAREVTVGHVGPMIDEYVNDGIPFLRSLNVRPHRLDTANLMRIGSTFHERLRKSALKPGDVVTVRTGKPGQTALIPDWLLESNCADLIITRPGPELDGRWISYYLNSITDGHIASQLVGAVQQHFNVKSLSSTVLLLPSISEQGAIVEVLGALDDKIAANERQLHCSEKLAAALFERSTFRSACEEVAYSEVAEIGGGGTPRTSEGEYWNGPIAWATPKDLTGLTAPYLTTTSRTITEEGLASCSSDLYPPGSILMTSRATIGAFAIAQDPVAVNQGFIVVNAKNRKLQWWLYHDMRSRVDEFLSFANGATFLELPRGKFRSLPFRLPEREIFESFDEQVAALHASAASTVRGNEQLKVTRDELLPLLMSGKLRVKDAEKIVEEVL